MKQQFRFGFLCAALLTVFTADAQTFNWKNLKKEEKHILNLNTNIDHAITFGTAYSYQLKSKNPFLLNAEFSLPAGDDLFDDFKIKTGSQWQWFHSEQFYFASRLQGIFRRYSNSYVRLLNFGADISSTAGYYKTHWFAAVEVGFDKAIITHFKHSDIYKVNYPDVKDGFYEPSTGGSIYYGIQSGYSFKKKDIYFKLGKIIEQDFETPPILPFYAQLGLNIRLYK